MMISIDANVILSPLADFCTLGATYIGTGYNTREEMENVLFFDDVSATAQRDAFQLLCSGLSNNIDQLYVADRLYADPTYNISAEYRNATKSLFDIALESVDFA